MHFFNSEISKHNFAFDGFCSAWLKHPHYLFDEIETDAALSVLKEKCTTQKNKKSVKEKHAQELIQL